MTKQEAINFINSLESDIDGRIQFISNEMLDVFGTNTRTVNSTKAMMIDRLTNNFDDNLYGSFRDGVMTTIFSFENNLE